MIKYKLSTYKLVVHGEYETEEEAIKDLSDKYMQGSRCDPPGKGYKEQLFHLKPLLIKDIAKEVYFYIEEEIHGIKQFVQKATLIIHPFKQEHWWSEKDDFKFKKCKFKYEVKEGD